MKSSGKPRIAHYLASCPWLLAWRIVALAMFDASRIVRRANAAELLITDGGKKYGDR
jgi:hypothetical protein